MALEWATLLQQQQDDGRLGLTPSFLVGALRRWPGAILGTDPGHSELCALLEMMRDERTPNGKLVSVFECQNILQPVAALSTSVAPGDPIQSRMLGYTQLHVWPWVAAQRPVGFDWLLQAVWIQYGEAISSGCFSYHRRTRRFGPFDKDDEDFIERARFPAEEM